MLKFHQQFQGAPQSEHVPDQRQGRPNSEHCWTCHMYPESQACARQTTCFCQVQPTQGGGAQRHLASRTHRGRTKKPGLQGSSLQLNPTSHIVKESSLTKVGPPLPSFQPPPHLINSSIRTGETGRGIRGQVVVFHQHKRGSLLRECHDPCPWFPGLASFSQKPNQKHQSKRPTKEP